MAAASRTLAVNRLKHRFGFDRLRMARDGRARVLWNQLRIGRFDVRRDRTSRAGCDRIVESGLCPCRLVAFHLGDRGLKNRRFDRTILSAGTSNDSPISTASTNCLQKDSCKRDYWHNIYKKAGGFAKKRF